MLHNMDLRYSHATFYGHSRKPVRDFYEMHKQFYKTDWYQQWEPPKAKMITRKAQDVIRMSYKLKK